MYMYMYMYIYTYIYIYFFFSWLQHAACEILVPEPGTKPMGPTVEVQNLNCWITREVPTTLFRF